MTAKVYKLSLSLLTSLLPKYTNSLSLSLLTSLLLCAQGSLVSRVVHHFQFTAWPENGAPEEGAGMIDLIGQVLRVQQQTGEKPIIVHCR